MLTQFFSKKQKFFKQERTKQVVRKSTKFVFLFICIQAIFFSTVYSGTISISGKITSSRIPIRYAQITFIDASDTTNKIYTSTDNLGKYEIELTSTAISEPSNSPEEFELAQNYPNPFANTTAIPFKINKRSNVKITIYDILGRKVKNFTVGVKSVGTHNVVWDGLDQSGSRAAQGVYFYKIQANGKSLVKKMILDPNGSNSIAIPSLNSQSFSSSSLSKTSGTKGGNVYNIRVENTTTTIPLLVSEELENVTIKNDTTINLSVEYIPLATVNFDSTCQLIRGYGAASPWYLSVATDSEIESAFGTDEGEIGLTIYRISVESDSSRWYKWVPGTKKAQEMGAMIMASPWYAPSSITETRDDETRIKLDKYAEYADHLNAFVKYMEKNGVSLYGLSVQNEPEMGDWTNWSTGEMFDFMKNYAGAIEGTRVMAPEVSNFDRDYSDLILNDSTACANTDIICGHIYGGGLYSYPLAAEKGKEVWMTEYLIGENNSGNNLSKAIELAENINDVMASDMNAYVWWTMIRYYGPIGDGKTASDPADPNESYPAKGEVTKKGYVMSQFSKFIRPGYYRVNSSVSPFSTKVEATAYKDPSTSKVIIVVINPNSSETLTAVRVENDAMTSTFTPYTTSESKNCEQGSQVNITDGVLYYTMEPMSITTFVME